MLKGLITIKKQEIISIKSTFEELDSDSQVKSDELINWNDKMLTKFRPLKEMFDSHSKSFDSWSELILYSKSPLLFFTIVRWCTLSKFIIAGSLMI